MGTARGRGRCLRAPGRGGPLPGCGRVRSRGLLCPGIDLPRRSRHAVSMAVFRHTVALAPVPRPWLVDALAVLMDVTESTREQGGRLLLPDGQEFPDVRLVAGRHLRRGAVYESIEEHALRRRALAGAVQGDRRPRSRQDRQHLLGGVPRRVRRTAQLRGGQGRDRRPDGLHGPRPRQVRRDGERDLPARPHPDDRGRLRRAPTPPTKGWTRSPPSTSPPSSATWPPRPPPESTANCSSCTAGWSR